MSPVRFQVCVCVFLIPNYIILAVLYEQIIIYVTPTHYLHVDYQLHIRCPTDTSNLYFTR